MLKLQFVPDQQNYSMRDQNNAHRVELYGGQSRYRTESKDNDLLIDCQFTLTPYNYQYFRAFYNYADQGADDFLIDLITEQSTLREHQARFRPGSWKLNDVGGYRFRVAVSLDVASNTTGLDFPAIVDSFVGDVVDPGYATGIRHLKVLPDQSNYNLTDPDAQLVTNLRAPREASRANFGTTEMRLQLQFSLNPAEYNYLRAFYQVHQSSLPFVVTLLGEGRELRPYVARLAPATWKLSRVGFDLFQVKMELFVLPYDLYADQVAIHTTFVPQPYVDPVYPGDFGGEEFE